MSFGTNPQTMYKGSVPDGYFGNENVLFIQNKITEVLSRQFKQKIKVPKGDITRILQRIIEERLESIPKMNERVVMTITNDFRNHQQERKRNMRWEEFYPLSQSLMDINAGSQKFDQQIIKLPNRLGYDRVGGSQRFYFTS